MNKIPALFFITLLLFVPLTLYSYGTAGSVSGNILTHYPDAAIQASGNAGVASLRPDWQYVQVNPAFLSFLRWKSFGFSNSNLHGDIKATNVTAVNEFDEFSYFAGIRYYDYGNFQRTTYFDDNLGDFSAKSLVLSGYITTPPVKNIYTGFGIKYFYESLAGHTGQAVAVDFGGLYIFEDYPVALGFSVQNIGTKIKYTKKTEDLPLLLRIGGSYYVLENKIGLFVDYERIRNQDGNVYIGAAYKLSEHFTVRGGINSVNEISKGLTLGFDVDILPGFSLNYAYIDNNSFEGTHNLTLTYFFDIIRIQEPLRRTTEKIQEVRSNIISRYEDYKERYETHKQDQRLPQEKTVDAQRNESMRRSLNLVEQEFNYDSVYYNLAVINYQRGNYYTALENINKLSDFDSDAIRLLKMIEDKIK